MSEVDLRDLLKVLWKRKWIFVVIPLVAACVTFVVSHMKSPMYTSSAKIAVGDFNSKIYNEPQAVQQLIQSKDFLEPIRKKLNLNVLDVKVKPIPDTNVIQFESSYTDPLLAKKIIEEVMNEYLRQSEEVYQEKTGPLQKLLATLQKRYEQTERSLDQNKSTLTSLNSNTNLNATEKDFSRTRLTDYILKDESLLTELIATMQDVQVKASKTQKTVVIEQANTPVAPNSPSPTFNSIVALVGGIFASVFLTFLIEYFQKNPMSREAEKNVQLV